MRLRRALVFALITSLLVLTLIYVHLASRGVVEISLRFNYNSSDPLIDTNAIGDEDSDVEVKPPRVRGTTKYFTYNGLFGKYNNQYISLVLGVVLSRRLGRQLVFPGWIDRYYAPSGEYCSAPLPLATYLDGQWIRKGRLRIVDKVVYETSVLPFIPSTQRKVLDLPVHIPSETFSALDALRLLSSTKEIHLEVGPIFHWKFHTKYFHRRIYPYLRPSPHILSIATNFLRHKLKRPYLGIHLRKSEGYCTQNSSSALVRIRSVMKMQNFSSVFLASDHQDLVAEGHIREELKPYMFTQRVEGVYTPGIIDFILLANSDYLLINRYSTLSFNAARARVHWYKKLGDVGYLTPDPKSNGTSTDIC